MLKIPDGSYSNINKYVLGELHAKFGAFVRSVTIILKFDAKPPDYKAHNIQLMQLLSCALQRMKLKLMYIQATKI